MAGFILVVAVCVMGSLALFLQEFRNAGGGREPQVVVSAPGRVNLLGQHIDHQGGFTNPVAISRRIRIALSTLEQPVLRCRNADPAYPPFDLDLRGTLNRVSGGWDDVLRADLIDTIPGLRDNWSRYVVAALLHIAAQGSLADPSRGYFVFVEGDIPPAAGLSSSSALVVAAMAAFLKVLGVSSTAEELVGWAGEAEHFVGTRGGCGDHAAILLAAKGHVSHFGFHPFRLVRQVAFPEDWRVLVCHSGVRAEKAAGVRAKFNHRVMAYHLGRLWMRGFLPEGDRTRIVTLRNFLPPDSRGLPALYKLLKKLPESATTAEIRAQLNGVAPEADACLAQLEEGEPLDLRGICLFGLAEIARSQAFVQLLEHGQMDRVAEIMALSHNGDRAVQHDLEGGIRTPYLNDYSDAVMARLAHQALFDWGNPHSPSQLWRQPGRYHSSTLELDLLVDLVRLASPRAGAHLSGAGLGGAIVALCPAAHVDRVSATLEKRYYAPRHLEPMIYGFDADAGATLDFIAGRQATAPLTPAVVPAGA